MFNRSQLITYEGALDLAFIINHTPLYDGTILGGGIKPVLADQSKSGVYRLKWEGGPLSFPEPQYLNPETGLVEYAYLFRFNNGAEGVNAGLVQDKFKRYPMSPAYVINSFRAEIEALAANR